MIAYRKKAYLKYLCKARHRHGHGIHTPFLYKLLVNVIENEGAYYLYEKMDALSAIVQQGLNGQKRNRPVDLSVRFGRLLFRLVNERLPASVVMWGPSEGMNPVYAALANMKTQVLCVQDGNATFDLMKRQLESAKLTNISSCERLDLAMLPVKEIAFAFVNAKEFPAKAAQAIEWMLAHRHADMCMMIQGIHEQEEAAEHWNLLLKRPDVRIAIDLFSCGILFTNPDLPKEDFVIRF